MSRHQSSPDIETYVLMIQYPETGLPLYYYFNKLIVGGAWLCNKIGFIRSKSCSSWKISVGGHFCLSCYLDTWILCGFKLNLHTLALFNSLIYRVSIHYHATSLSSFILKPVYFLTLLYSQTDPHTFIYYITCQT